MTGQPLPRQMGFSARTPIARRRWDQDIPYYEFTDGAWVNLRFFGNPESILTMVPTHWLTTRKGKKFPMNCINYDIQKQEFTGDACPICELNPKESTDKGIKDLAVRFSGLSHVLDRDIQKQGTKPWYAIRVPMSIIIALQNLAERNQHTIEGQTYEADVADPYYGRDVSIKYDSSQSNPQMKYSVDKGDHTPLTEIEKTYIDELYDFRSLIEYPDRKEVQKALSQNGYYAMANMQDEYKMGGAQVHDLSVPTPSVPQPPRGDVDAVPPPPITNGIKSPAGYQPEEEIEIPFAPEAKKKVSEPEPAPVPSVSSVSSVPKPEVPKPIAAVPDEPKAEPKVEAAPAQGNIYTVKGVPGGVNEAKLKELIAGHSAGLSNGRGKPLIVAEKGELQGMEVVKCFGSYKGDMHCVRCPTRTYCLQV